MKKRFLIFCFFSLSFLFAQTALDFYTRGQQYQENAAWMKAIEAYQEALNVNPSYAAAWFALSESTYALGEYALALQYAESAERFIRNDRALLNLKGFIYIGLGEIKKASDLFLQVVKSYPNDIDARFGLAELELFSGKKTAAERYYKETLARQGENKKALLSLAILSYDMGNIRASKDFIQTALRYHSGESEVHYFASYLAVQDGDLALAEKHAKNALHLQPKNAKTIRLLSLIHYSQKKYNEATENLDRLLSLDKLDSFSWYLKAKIAEKQHNTEGALVFYQRCLEINPEDEIARAAMEICITKATPIEDARRKGWAAYQLKKAQEATRLYLSETARYHYKRALKINPLDTDTRLLYAGLLLQDGRAESYLSQLEFIQNEGAKSLALSDLIESYASLLRSSLSQKWKTNPLYLDKTRYRLSLFYLDEGVHILHPDSLAIASQMIKETAEMQGLMQVSTEDSSVASYAEAFQKAREKGTDLFAILSFEETEREVLGELTLYNAKTGTKIQTISVYRTGNDRFTQTIQKLVSQLTKALPLRGRIIARSGYTALIDLGKTEGIEKNMELSIVEKGRLSLDSASLRLLTQENNILGSISIEEVGEEMAEGRVSYTGFFDKIGVGDEVFIALPLEDTEGKNLSSNQNTTPVLIDLLRSIR
ncbi:MAG TPA: tetratricopeptide repeat protein [Treponemataceae bacterium]|nr:tetratricopeptide repeat protein [Treponemataceae bacterium]HOQ93047.1 tetratricopeptide repeat protein [Treponemataceae bacterium]